MIYVDVKGNLGNQLFEYACARNIQQKTGQEICLNTAFLNRYRTDMVFSLEDYKLNNMVIIEKNKKMPWYTNTYSGLTRVLKKFIPSLYFDIMKRFGAFVWIKTTYKRLPIGDKKNYYLAGYWQCNKYFDEIKDILLAELTPKQDRIKENKKFYEVIENTESICVTIRRGDYLTNDKIRSHHYVCGPEFFIEGVNRIRDKIPNATVCVFSDDIEWVKNNIEFGGQVYYERGDDPVWEKLRLMSLCKHFVISNSSFSWWAQYLSVNPQKIVYAPSNWYADGTEADIYEDNWNYIEV